MPSVERVTVPGIGMIGVVCGQETTDHRVQKTPKGPLHRAQCNRWAEHDGPHRMTRPRDFAVLAEWTDKECRPRTWMEIRRKEMAKSQRIDDPPPAVGWKFISWTGPSHSCNVEACGRWINAGHVRVDNQDPTAFGFAVICEDCHFKIMCGIDPDPDAPIPQWETERRIANANPDA